MDEVRALRALPRHRRGAMACRSENSTAGYGSTPVALRGSSLPQVRRVKRARAIHPRAGGSGAVEARNLRGHRRSKTFRLSRPLDGSPVRRDDKQPRYSPPILTTRARDRSHRGAGAGGRSARRRRAGSPTPGGRCGPWAVRTGSGAVGDRCAFGPKKWFVGSVDRRIERCEHAVGVPTVDPRV